MLLFTDRHTMTILPGKCPLRLNFTQQYSYISQNYHTGRKHCASLETCTQLNNLCVDLKYIAICCAVSYKQTPFSIQNSILCKIVIIIAVYIYVKARNSMTKAT